MKPAEQSTIVAHGFMKLLLEAGFPAGVIHFVPGLGETVGEALVQHPKTANIAFTGSQAVGVHIMKQAADLKPKQKQLKRVSAELGGKNALIIDSDADLDEAVDAVLTSAFGFAGQKCSACSRAIVLDEVFDKFQTRLVEATRSLELGSALDPKSYFGPVIDQDSFDRIQKLISDSQLQHKLLFQGPKLSEGFFVPPTIFTDVNPDSDLAQKEIFGPVLSLIRAKDMTHAIQIANSADTALTGGLFSRSPANIEMTKRDFECGNLYINRGITGALVERHPFGGYKLSGTGSKAGGPDYLKIFMEARCLTENTVRRGFAPPEPTQQ
jgi:RHH-type transcriptional regulator, proline utilization regulon repressor / proline dehydrogenase / delta 1-pyrroline-5-carboxylate dehydrogenase